MISHQSLRRLKRRRHTVVHVQCRDMLQDVTSRTLNLSLGSAAQQGAPRLGYLGTTASSRAKKGQDPASEEKENLDLQSSDQDQTCSPQELATPPAMMSLGRATPPDVVSLGGATPPAVMSLGGVRRWSLCSEEETLTNPNLTIIISPTPTRDTSDIIEQEAGDPGSLDPPASSSSPLTETQYPPPVAMVILLQCQSVAMELREATRRAVLLHQQLSDGTQPPQVVSVLKGAFAFVLSELQAVRGEDEASLSLVAMTPRISEESCVSNSSVSSDASSEASCSESTQKETSVSGADVTSRTLNLSLGSAAQQGAPRLGYLGTTASSRAKKGQDPASEEKENLDLQSSDQDQTCSPQELATPPAMMSLGRATPPDVVSLGGATPPAVMSLGGVRRWSLCSEEETLTNPNLTIIISPTPTRDTSDIIEQEAGDPGSLDPPASSSSPLTETQYPPPVAMVILLQCQSVAMELREATRRSVLLHQQLSDCTQPPQVVSVLKGAFEASLSLLEKYSELLVQMTREKLDRV
ncbi:uncharacterized protein [Pseudochaenichthys georgianus]|uniref:uncharacterized protein isoform X2 n=1 Tax=Pseudochaenichthys georgianus TaxID=52239 RepID=UPI00146A4E8C|nr:uncharacterized protein LOC117442092 [Pseudochaenichthys georgianus]